MNTFCWIWQYLIELPAHSTKEVGGEKACSFLLAVYSECKRMNFLMCKENKILVKAMT